MEPLSFLPVKLDSKYQHLRRLTTDVDEYFDELTPQLNRELTRFKEMLVYFADVPPKFYLKVIKVNALSYWAEVFKLSAGQSFINVIADFCRDHQIPLTAGHFEQWHVQQQAANNVVEQYRQLYCQHFKRPLPTIEWLMLNLDANRPTDDCPFPWEPHLRKDDSHAI